MSRNPLLPISPLAAPTKASRLSEKALAARPNTPELGEPTPTEETPARALHIVIPRRLPNLISKSFQTPPERPDTFNQREFELICSMLDIKSEEDNYEVNPDENLTASL